MAEKLFNNEILDKPAYRPNLTGRQVGQEVMKAGLAKLEGKPYEFPGYVHFPMDLLKVEDMPFDENGPPMEVRRNLMIFIAGQTAHSEMINTFCDEMKKELRNMTFYDWEVVDQLIKEKEKEHQQQRGPARTRTSDQPRPQNGQNVEQPVPANGENVADPQPDVDAAPGLVNVENVADPQPDVDVDDAPGLVDVENVAEPQHGDANGPPDDNVQPQNIDDNVLAANIPVASVGSAQSANLNDTPLPGVSARDLMHHCVVTRSQTAGSQDPPVSGVAAGQNVTDNRDEDEEDGGQPPRRPRVRRRRNPDDQQPQNRQDPPETLDAIIMNHPNPIRALFHPDSDDEFLQPIPRRTSPIHADRAFINDIGLPGHPHRDWVIVPPQDNLVAAPDEIEAPTGAPTDAPIGAPTDAPEALFEPGLPADDDGLANMTVDPTNENIPNQPPTHDQEAGGAAGDELPDLTTVYKKVPWLELFAMLPDLTPRRRRRRHDSDSEEPPVFEVWTNPQEDHANALHPRVDNRADYSQEHDRMFEMLLENQFVYARDYLRPYRTPLARLTAIMALGEAASNQHITLDKDADGHIIGYRLKE